MSPIFRTARAVCRQNVRSYHDSYPQQVHAQTQPRMVQKERDHFVLNTMKGNKHAGRVKPERIYKLTSPLASTSNVLPPEKKFVVNDDDLPKGQPADDFWGIGQLVYPEKTDPVDDFDTDRALNVKSFLPGDKAPKKLFRNWYDIRVCKYLWTLDQKGINICREMKPCASSRGIVLHSKVSPMAVVGGEAWFSPKEDAVTINFCSGRYPLKDDKAIPKLAKLWLNFFPKVYVVVPPERYGNVTPTLFQRADQSSL